MPELSKILVWGEMMDAVMIRNRVKEMRLCKPSELADHPHQWRVHPRDQRDALEGILREVGIAGTLLAWHSERNGGQLTAIDGHLRKSLDPGIKWPTVILDVTDAEADLLLATHDPLAAMAEAGRAELDALLREVATEEAAVKAMLATLSENVGIIPPAIVGGVQDVMPQVDRAVELQGKWETALGQVWEIPSRAVSGGVHRLLCGDATSDQDVHRLLQNIVPALMVTDSPYGVNYDPEWRIRYDHFDRRSKGRVANDNRSDWTQAWMLFPGDVVYVWHAALFAMDVAKHLMDAGFRIRSQIIWNKQHFVFGRGAYHYKHEPCWYAVRDGKNARWIGDHSQTTVWDIQSSNPFGGSDRSEKTVHATEKPLECMARAIHNHEGDVYDPFLGSGTTMVAAEQQGRVCYGIEIEPLYIAVILQRLADVGLSPHLVDPV